MPRPVFTDRCRQPHCGNAAGGVADHSRRRVAWAILVSAVALNFCGRIAGAAGPDWDARRAPPSRVLPAEFERQDAVLITWDPNDEGMQQAVVDVVGSAWHDVNFYMLVPNVAAEAEAMRALRAVGVPRRAVKFLYVPTDSVWTRDFGPQVVLQRDGSSQMVDCDYGHGDRVGDDLVPAAIAPNLGMRTLRPPITADGGNIQTNGRGLALTTSSLIEHNADRGYTADEVARVFRDYYGITDLVFLEPLEGESTGHVDMFAVFVSADTVLVGKYEHDQDPVNAELLDRNAARLERVRGPGGPLRVIRVPMPPRDEKVWRTYTNVLFANGTLLVPKYPGVDPHGHATAVATYRRLLPQWRVVGIDCSRLIEWGGALHCMTMNLARVPANGDAGAVGHAPLPEPDEPRMSPAPGGRLPLGRDQEPESRRDDTRRFADVGAADDYGFSPADDHFELPTTADDRSRSAMPQRSSPLDRKRMRPGRIENTTRERLRSLRYTGERRVGSTIGEGFAPAEDLGSPRLEDSAARTSPAMFAPDHSGGMPSRSVAPFPGSRGRP